MLEKITLSATSQRAVGFPPPHSNNQKLESAEDTKSVVRWISEKVLESNRDVTAAGQKGQTSTFKSLPA
jgi:hypothetical protein